MTDETSTSPHDEWNDEVVPLLEAIDDAAHRGEDYQWPALVNPDDRQHAAKAINLWETLVEAGYIYARDARAMGPRIVRVWDVRLTEKGKRAIGHWPPDEMYAGVVRTLELAIDRAPDKEVKSRLRRALEGLTGVGRDVFVTAAGGAIGEQFGSL